MCINGHPNIYLTMYGKRKHIVRLRMHSIKVDWQPLLHIWVLLWHDLFYMLVRVHNGNDFLLKRKKTVKSMQLSVVIIIVNNKNKHNNHIIRKNNLTIAWIEDMKLFQLSEELPCFIVSKNLFTWQKKLYICFYSFKKKGSNKWRQNNQNPTKKRVKNSIKLITKIMIIVI